MHVPPCFASTVHSLATGGPPSSHLSSATSRCGGCHSVMVADDTMPPPKSLATLPPTRPSTFVGTNQAEIPGPLAIACQTCSGVPLTSTSTWTLRRPDGSFFTLMLGTRLSEVNPALTGRADGRERRGDANARPARRHRDSAPVERRCSLRAPG